MFEVSSIGQHGEEDEVRGHYTDSAKLGKLRQVPGMARLARVVVPGMGHHITQRGNRRPQIFFRDEDYAA